MASACMGLTPSLAMNKEQKASSDFVRNLIHNSGRRKQVEIGSPRPPQKIVQFWHSLDQLPPDVAECLDSWNRLKEAGFEILLFDHKNAMEYIQSTLGSRFEQAYERCYHPAMQSDYFRLCYLHVEGGCYVDADDVYLGPSIARLFRDSRLKVQPLCYDIPSNQMVPAAAFVECQDEVPDRIYYFNNNPLIAPKGHPIIERALETATTALIQPVGDKLPEIQSTTGPGNLTRSVFDHAKCSGEIESSLLVLCNWESVAVSKWPLSYRFDDRNWRRSNQRAYFG